MSEGPGPAPLRVLRRFAPYLRGHRLMLAGAVLALIFSTVCVSLSPGR